MRIDITTRQEKSRELFSRQYFIMQLAAAIFTVLFFAFYLSPQLWTWGRGLRTLLPLFMGIMALSMVNIPLKRVFENQYLVPIACGIIFFLNGFWRNLIEPRPTSFDNIKASLYCLMAYIVVLSIKKVFPSILEPIRWTTLLIFGLSLLMGLPALMQDPMIARIRSTGYAGQFAFAGKSGIATFTTYSSIAIAWAGIANWLYINRSPLLLRIAGWGALTVLTISTLVSTFSMALLILVISIVSTIILGIPTGKNTFYRGMALLLCIALIGVAPIIYNLSLDSSYLSYSTAKITRIITDSLFEGPIQGDSTTRAWRIQKTLDSFFRSPIVGAWGVIGDSFSGGHSDFFDILGLLGVTGVLLWFSFLFPYLRRKSLNSLRLNNGLGGSSLSWILYLVAGMMNPIWIRAEVIILLCLYDNININGFSVLTNLIHSKAGPLR